MSDTIIALAFLLAMMLLPVFLFGLIGFLAEKTKRRMPKRLSEALKTDKHIMLKEHNKIYTLYLGYKNMCKSLKNERKILKEKVFDLKLYLETNYADVNKDQRVRNEINEILK